MHLISPGLSESVYRVCNAFGFMADRLYPIEACLIGRLFDHLPEDYRVLFQKQFDCYSTFQRGGWGWTQLLMYPKSLLLSRRTPFPNELKVETEKEDVRLASFKFRVQGQEEENNAVFHVVNGRLFSIDFGADYRPLRFADDLEILKYKVNRSSFPSLEVGE